MATYRSIATTETDPQAPVTSALMKALEANPIAAFEGDATAVSAGVTLKDPALDTGAATAAGTAWVGLRTAGLAVGSVGSYAYLRHATNNTAITAGTTYAGSDLRYSGVTGTNGVNTTTGGTPSGTWRAMGTASNASGQSSSTLFLRIA
jgi:hypothetical protein